LQSKQAAFEIGQNRPAKGTAMPQKKDNRSGEKISDMEGIVIPVRWDEDGNPTAIALATQGEQEFLINMRDKMGKKLLAFLQKKVRIFGAVTLCKNNQKMITIRKYMPIAYDEFVVQSTNQSPANFLQ
jgi:hypothetical protein